MATYTAHWPSQRSARRLVPIVLFQQIGLVLWIRSNFRPTATRFEGEATVGNAAVVGSTSHATSVHEVLDEEADAINRFHRFHALCRDRTCSVSVLAPVQVLARPLRSVQTQAPPPADKLWICEERSARGPSEGPAPDHHLDRWPTGLAFWQRGPDRTLFGVHGNSGASYAPRRVQRDQQTTMAPFKYL